MPSGLPCLDTENKVIKKCFAQTTREANIMPFSSKYLNCMKYVLEKCGLIIPLLFKYTAERKDILIEVSENNEEVRFLLKKLLPWV